MDATAKKLVEMLAGLQRQIADLQRQANAVSSVLESLGLRLEDDPRNPSDARYAEDRTFAATSLVDACKRILADQAGKYFTKGQVEYLAAIGGYPFATGDQKNSVAVTLRRLADQGFCEVERAGGHTGNRYRWVRPKDEREAEP
jgi:hypothetical protein